MHSRGCYFTNVYMTVGYVGDHIFDILVSLKPSPGKHFTTLIWLLSLPQDQITITGYEQKAIAARDAIQAIVDELEEMISEDITLDSRVHARIIGARGKGIRKIMDEFKVRWREQRRMLTRHNCVFY